MKLTKPQIVAIIMPLITAIAGYLGYQPIQELRHPAPDVDVTVTVPEQAPHTHKNWGPVMDDKIKKAIDDNNEIYH